MVILAITSGCNSTSISKSPRSFIGPSGSLIACLSSSKPAVVIFSIISLVPTEP